MPKRNASARIATRVPTARRLSAATVRLHVTTEVNVRTDTPAAVRPATEESIVEEVSDKSRGIASCLVPSSALWL